jgi:hypothetical protein
MPLSSIELQQVASLSRRRHGFDSRTGRHHTNSLCGTDQQLKARLDWTDKSNLNVIAAIVGDLVVPHR